MAYTVAMSSRSAKLILQQKLQSSPSPLSTGELCRAIDDVVDRRTVLRWLTDWKEQGLVVKSGDKKGARYCWVKGKTAHHFAFLDNVPQHRHAALLNQIRDIWTHTSTAIEGNTLTLGDTFEILEHGLTISGKPIREHQEIIGHARAIELIYALVFSKREIHTQDLFDLHKAVQTEQVMDINKPYGHWKIEPNGCNAVDQDDKPVYIEYAHPVHVERLIEQFLMQLNQSMAGRILLEEAADVYAKLHIGFVHIHPFWDGNGRLARLVANLPLLRAGLPPLTIDSNQRAAYIKALSSYQIQVGQITPERGVWPISDGFESFTRVCQNSYKTILDLVSAASEFD
jgi:Fe2+ or Zn2+ uptake regulation protein